MAEAPPGARPPVSLHPPATVDTASRKAEALTAYAQGCELSAESDPQKREEAVQCFRRALTIAQEIGAPFPEAQTALDEMQRERR